MIKQSSEFRSLDAREKAATEGALASFRAIAERIAQELDTTKPEHLSIESLADFCASLERAVEILAHMRDR
jgi:ubiquinone biosynthesis protein UbiJ